MLAILGLLCAVAVVYGVAARARAALAVGLVLAVLLALLLLAVWRSSGMVLIGGSGPAMEL